MIRPTLPAGDAFTLMISGFCANMRSKIGLKSVKPRSKNSFATVVKPNFSVYCVSTLMDHQPVSSFGLIVASRLIAG